MSQPPPAAQPSPEKIKELEKKIRVLSKQLERSERHRQTIEQAKDQFDSVYQHVIDELNEQKKLLAESQSAVRRANATKDKFFSIIAHDLRGPIGSLSVLFNEVFNHGSEINDDTYDSIRNTSKNTHQLLESLLSWAGSQNGDIKFSPVHFPIATALQLNLELFKGAAQQKKIRLWGDLDQKLYAHADLQMVTTIIRNLLGNALKYTPAGKEIWIDAQREGEQIRVAINDSGVGMSDAVLSTLFQLDQKVTSTMGTNREEGSGLGLILCSEFVSRQGGEIGVTSEIGKGSCFWFTLPVGECPFPEIKIQ